MDIAHPMLPIASAFSSAGVGMAGYVEAGFTPVYALEIGKGPAAIFDANFRFTDGSSVINVKDAFDVTGYDIKRQVHKFTGSSFIALLEQGPSCQDYTNLNTSGKDFGRRPQMLKALQLIEEAEPLIAVIEEVPEFLLPKHKDVSDAYFDKVERLNYRSAYRVVNSIHYGSNQARERFIHIFIHTRLGKNPVFPTPDILNVRRVKDFLDIDHYLTGHFSDPLKSKHHFMSTVTSGSPKYFYKGDIKRSPTIAELMLCCDLNPNKYKAVGTTTDLKQAFGNGIPAKLTYAIGKTLIDEVLCVEKSSSGLWVKKK